MEKTDIEKENNCLVLAGVSLMLAVSLATTCAYAGNGDIVKAASFGFNPTNATSCLQNAFDSGASIVVLERQASDWVVGPLWLRSNTEIVIGSNVTVRALKGDFKKKADSLFSAVNVSNVTIRGEGGSLIVMEKKDYQNKELYMPGEHRHAINIRNSQTIAVSNLTVKSSGGDGVYLARVHDARIENVDCLDHHRQGMSIISARNLLVRNCSFCDTKGTPPSAGVDFEPNRGGGFFENIRFERCTFKGNAASGLSLYLKNMTAANSPLDIVFDDCALIDNRASGMGFFGNFDGDIRGKVEFNRCRFEGNKMRNRSVKLPGKAKVLFNDCLVGPDGDADYSKLRPVPKGTPTAPGEVGASFWRKPVTFYQYVPKGGQYRIRFEAKPLGRHGKPKFHLEATGLGEPLSGDLEFTGADTEFVINAKHEDFVRIDITPVRSAVRIVSDMPGNGVLLYAKKGLFRCSGSRMWFAVPAGVETVAVEGARYEPTSVRLVAPDGSVAAELGKGVCKGFRLEAKRRPNAPLEVWAVEFPAMDEDCVVAVCEPCIPLVAATPEAVLAPVDGSQANNDCSNKKETP